MSTNANKNENMSPAISAVGHIDATASAIVVQYIGKHTPYMRYVNPARELSKPTVQNQHRKNRLDPRMFHGNSVKICAVVSADQWYIRLDFSRIS